MIACSFGLIIILKNTIMKSICTGILLSFFLFMTNAYGQNRQPTVKDSITFFYNDLLSNLELKYLNRAYVDWAKIKKYTLEQALKADDFSTSLATTSVVFDTIKCNHCKLFSDSGFYGSTLNKQLSQEDFSREFLVELEKNPSFQVKRINKNIGYINMPGMLMIDLTQDALNIEAQKMYDEIVELQKTKKIKGWVIDLRFNGGGNVFPMLAALHSLLGDNIMYNAIDNEGINIGIHTLRKGGFYEGKEVKAKVIPSIIPDTEIPVALLIGKLTGSSGEDIAVAFKNRKNVIFIGENTYGFLTGNDLYELPYAIKVALTTSYITDAHEKYQAYITPDIEIIKEANFEDLTKDKNVMEAIKFINTKN